MDNQIYIFNLMEKIYSKNFANVIIPDRYFLIIDNKDNRRFVNINMKKVKMHKKEMDVTFFENKELNTFWSVDFEGNKSIYTQINHKEFFNESSMTTLNTP